MASREVSYFPRLASPAPGVPHDHFALVGTTEWDLPAGRYEVRIFGDDGIRVLIDGQKVLERWPYMGNYAERAELTLATGKHRIRVEYFQNTGAARLQFALRRIRDAN